LGQTEEGVAFLATSLAEDRAITPGSVAEAVKRYNVYYPPSMYLARLCRYTLDRIQDLSEIRRNVTILAWLQGVQSRVLRSMLLRALLAVIAVFIARRYIDPDMYFDEASSNMTCAKQRQVYCQDAAQCLSFITEDQHPAVDIVGVMALTMMARSFVRSLFVLNAYQARAVYAVSGDQYLQTKRRVLIMLGVSILQGLTLTLSSMMLPSAHDNVFHMIAAGVAVGVLFSTFVGVVGRYFGSQHVGQESAQLTESYWDIAALLLSLLAAKREAVYSANAVLQQTLTQADQVVSTLTVSESRGLESLAKWIAIVHAIAAFLAFFQLVYSRSSDACCYWVKLGRTSSIAPEGAGSVDPELDALGLGELQPGRVGCDRGRVVYTAPGDFSTMNPQQSGRVSRGNAFVDGDTIPSQKAQDLLVPAAAPAPESVEPVYMAIELPQGDEVETPEGTYMALLSSTPSASQETAIVFAPRVDHKQSAAQSSDEGSEESDEGTEVWTVNGEDGASGEESDPGGY